jgi:hypothetical protein
VRAEKPPARRWARRTRERRIRDGGCANLRPAWVITPAGWFQPPQSLATTAPTPKRPGRGNISRPVRKFITRSGEGVRASYMKLTHDLHFFLCFRTRGLACSKGVSPARHSLLLALCYMVYQGLFGDLPGIVRSHRSFTGCKEPIGRSGGRMPLKKDTIRLEHRITIISIICNNLWYDEGMAYPKSGEPSRLYVFPRIGTMFSYVFRHSKVIITKETVNITTWSIYRRY